jgi:hypothetical protein
MSRRSPFACGFFRREERRQGFIRGARVDSRNWRRPLWQDSARVGEATWGRERRGDGASDGGQRRGGEGGRGGGLRRPDGPRGKRCCFLPRRRRNCRQRGLSVLFCAFAGLLGCWAAGLLGCWAAGLLGCWAAGLLGCWAAGLARFVARGQFVARRRTPFGCGRGSLRPDRQPAGRGREACRTPRAGRRRREVGDVRRVGDALRGGDRHRRAVSAAQARGGVG